MALRPHTRAAMGLKPMLTHGKNKALEAAKNRERKHFKSHLNDSRRSKVYRGSADAGSGKPGSGRLTPKQVYGSRYGSEYKA